MGINCGSQIILCDLPIRIDTYSGCSHGCKYCFVQRKKNIGVIKAENCIGQLKDFIAGKRKGEMAWCDWKIPLHFGGVSDPFQPIEKKHRLSYQAIKVLAEHQYPYVVSTKGLLAVDKEYLAVLKDGKCVVQVSMICQKYDVLEPGAPSYETRLKMCEAFAHAGKRVIDRIQPFMPEVLGDVLANIPRLAASGVHGVVVEGMKFFSKKNGLIKYRGDYCYPEPILKDCFRQIKSACHNAGMRFYSGENRLRTMGDSLCCCGIDGLEGFRGNDFNLMHLNAGENVMPTERMRQVGTAECFRPIQQETWYGPFLDANSFFTVMMLQHKKKALK